jgi:hypothetical protein
MRWLLHVALVFLVACMPATAGPPSFSTGGPGGSGSAITMGTIATIEASTCTIGDLGKPTDSPLELRCEATDVWTRYYLDLPCPEPPSTGWTAFNSGSVVANADGTRTLTLPAEVFTGNGLRGEERAVPSDPTVTPYEVSAVIVAGYRGDAANIGLIQLGHTDGTGVAALTLGSGNGITTARWSAATTFVANDDIVISQPSLPVIAKVGEDATNRTFFLGDQIGGYESVGANGRAVTFTADANYWGGVAGDAEMTMTLTLVCWEENP